MKTYTTEELNKILELHKLYLINNPKGIRANLREADLREANLREANLRKADFRWAYLIGADFSGADFSGAYLSEADFRWANLREANLSGADLSGADLRQASLSGADLRQANLSWANLSWATPDYVIYQAYLGQYHIHTNREYIRIGCEYKTVTEWLSVTQEQAEGIGLDSKYYSDYMDFIRWYSKKDVSKLK